MKIIAPRFLSQADSFHNELKSRINSYFDDNSFARTGNYKLYLKAAILLLSMAGVYVHLVFFTPQWWLAVPECLLLGILTASIGFNIMHDGAHGSFSKYEWINRLAGLSLNVLGANVFMWKTKHNVVHHAFTNIAGIDDDIEAGPILRLCQTQKRYKMHRYQHLYAWLAYSMLYLYWVFFTDYEKYFTKKVGNMPLKKMQLRDHFSFWGFKVLHAALFIGLPVYLVGFLPWLVGFLVLSMSAGLILSIVFQLAHAVNETEFPVATGANQMEDEWAVHQLKTTANFATRNRFISWFAGGLNFQIEHHLFPKISHVHYPAISRIIREACAEYNIPYIHYPKMRMALASHVMHLRKMGRK